MPFFHMALFLSSCATPGKIPPKAVWGENIELDAARQPQRAFITPDMHDLVVLTKSDVPNETRLVPIKVPLHNGIIPAVRIAITPPVDSLRGDRFHYEYTISNDAKARDSITNVFVVLPSFAPGTDVDYYINGRKNGYWLSGIGSSAAAQSELDERELGRNMFWTSAWTEALAKSDSVNILPGHTKSGFTVESNEMPGFTTAALAGLHWAPPDGRMDQDTWRQVDELDIANYFDVTTLTFGPMFVTGAEPAEVLKNYRLGVEKLGSCGSVPHSAAFIEEISGILGEPGIESRLGVRLGAMKLRPAAPVELELMNCLRLVARAFENRSLGGRY
jgi:hypothetical protein